MRPLVTMIALLGLVSCSKKNLQQGSASITPKANPVIAEMAVQQRQAETVAAVKEKVSGIREQIRNKMNGNTLSELRDAALSQIEGSTYNEKAININNRAYVIGSVESLSKGLETFSESGSDDMTAEVANYFKSQTAKRLLDESTGVRPGIVWTDKDSAVYVALIELYTDLKYIQALQEKFSEQLGKLDPKVETDQVEEGVENVQISVATDQKVDGQQADDEEKKAIVAVPNIISDGEIKILLEQVDFATSKMVEKVMAGEAPTIAEIKENEKI